MDNLKSLMIPEKAVTFEFPGCPDFKVELVHLSKEKNRKIYEKCNKNGFDKNRRPTQTFDQDMFLELYSKAIIKNWTGFKLKYLQELLLVEVPEEKLDEELPYSEENALTLLTSSTVFDSWVNEVITDLANFTKSSSKEKSDE